MSANRNVTQQFVLQRLADTSPHNPRSISWLAADGAWHSGKCFGLGEAGDSLVIEKLPCDGSTFEVPLSDIVNLTITVAYANFLPEHH